MSRAGWLAFGAAVFAFGALWWWALFGLSEQVSLASSMSAFAFATLAAIVAIVDG